MISLRVYFKHAFSSQSILINVVKTIFFCSQQSSFQSDIESLNSSLEEERACTANLQGELTVTKSKLEEDMFRARSTLLMDIISMQLFYGVKELSLDDAPVLPENESSVKCLKDGYIQSVATTSKLLENTDLLLELFKGYLKMMNSKGEKLLENSGSLRLLIGTEEFLEEPSVLCETEDESLYLTNKTDDDKVVASLRCNETPLESHNKVIGSKEIRDNDEYSSLRDKLISLKNIIDDEALDFMKRAFEFDGDSIDQASRARKDIYERIQEFLEKRAAVPGKYVWILRCLKLLRRKLSLIPKVVPRLSMACEQGHFPGY